MSNQTNARSGWRVTLHPLLGFVIGTVSFAALGILQLIATGLNVGVLYGLNTEVMRVIGPAPTAIVSGLVFFLTLGAATLLASQLPWSSRVCAGAFLLIYGTVGTALFYPEYLGDPGAKSWVEDLLINGSQCLAVPLLAAILIVSGIHTSRSDRRVRSE